MVFGVLLSLFLFACVGIDTLEEVAYAATHSNTMPTGYEDYTSTNIAKQGTVATGVGINITALSTGTSAEEIVMAVGDTNSIYNSSVTNGWGEYTDSTTNQTIILYHKGFLYV